jgi:branched-chain amino acid transport system substrate-binding protein
MLIVSPSSVAVSLAIPGDNIFRFVSCDRLQGEAMNKMLTEDKIKVIVPFIRDDVWGNDLLASTRSHFTQVGGSVLPAIAYPPGTTSFGALMDELDAAVGGELSHHNPNEVGVYMLSFAEGARILAEARNHDHLNNVYWYGGSALALNPAVIADTGAVLFAYTHGMPCPIYGLDDDARDKWQPLRDRIEARLGRMPDVYALTAYDAFRAAVMTYTTTGPNPSTDLLKTAFRGVSDNFFGATGSTKLDENGDRAVGNYDFWGVKYDSTGYSWRRVARYNSSSGILVRMTE